jgi:hypothetical protein
MIASHTALPSRDHASFLSLFEVQYGLLKCNVRTENRILEVEKSTTAFSRRCGVGALLWSFLVFVLLFSPKNVTSRLTFLVNFGNYLLPPPCFSHTKGLVGTGWEVDNSVDRQQCIALRHGVRYKINFKGRFKTITNYWKNLDSWVP